MSKTLRSKFWLPRLKAEQPTHPYRPCLVNGPLGDNWRSNPPPLSCSPPPFPNPLSTCLFIHKITSVSFYNKYLKSREVQHQSMAKSGFELCSWRGTAIVLWLGALLKELQRVSQPHTILFPTPFPYLLSKCQSVEQNCINFLLHVQVFE